MADTRKVEPVEPDSPERCQAVYGAGQCRYKRSPGSEFCPMHGGNKGQAAQTALVKRQYQLAKWQADVDAFADEDQVKSLRGEIGITRLVLQSMLDKCRDTSDIVIYSSKIGDTVARIERLVTSCHRLESNMGLLLDKPRIIVLAQLIVDIIGQHIEDDDTIALIANGIVDAIVNTQGKVPDGKAH